MDQLISILVERTKLLRNMGPVALVVTTIVLLTAMAAALIAFR